MASIKHKFMEFFMSFCDVIRLDPTNLLTSLSNSHTNDVHIYCEEQNFRQVQNNA